jgi:hypothetical protein
MLPSVVPVKSWSTVSIPSELEKIQFAEDGLLFTILSSYLKAEQHGTYRQAQRE